MEQERNKEEDRDTYEPGQHHQPPYISQMKPVTHEAYGGGLYGKDDEEKETDDKEKEPPHEHKHKMPASETQSADGPDEAKTTKPDLKQPPLSGDVDVDVTGQSYIQ